MSMCTVRDRRKRSGRTIHCSCAPWSPSTNRCGWYWSLGGRGRHASSDRRSFVRRFSTIERWSLRNRWLEAYHLVKSYNSQHDSAKKRHTYTVMPPSLCREFPAHFCELRPRPRVRGCHGIRLLFLVTFDLQKQSSLKMELLLAEGDPEVVHR